MPKKATSTTLTYQALSQKLDEVLIKLQDSDTAIDDAVSYYEEAMKLIARLEQHLETAENRVRKIRATFVGTKSER
jgi:exodeoxyribonuclease VII small subunit